MPPSDPQPQHILSDAEVQIHVAGCLPLGGPPKGERPQAVLLMGPVCAGKSRMREHSFTNGYALLDAGAIFLRLTGSTAPRFPGPWAWAVNRIGKELFQAITRHRYSFVTELIGGDAQVLQDMIQALQTRDYKVDVTLVHANIETCVARQCARGDDNLSAYYTEGFHQKWILDLQMPELGD